MARQGATRKHQGRGENAAVEGIEHVFYVLSYSPDQSKIVSDDSLQIFFDHGLA